MNFLNELPLDLFGIELTKVVEIIADAPSKVNAFIGALVEIARNYSINEEHFYLAALRAWQEMHLNYFENIEQAAALFSETNDLLKNGFVEKDRLAELLENQFGYHVEMDGLAGSSAFKTPGGGLPHRETVAAESRNAREPNDLYFGQRIGFQRVGLKERPFSHRNFRPNSFDERLLNDFKADYFAVALLVNKNAFVASPEGLFFTRKMGRRPFPARPRRKIWGWAGRLFFNGSTDCPLVWAAQTFLPPAHPRDRKGRFRDRQGAGFISTAATCPMRTPAASIIAGVGHPFFCQKAGRDRGIAQKIGVMADASRIVFHDTGEEYACLTIARQTGDPGETWPLFLRWKLMKT